MANPCILLKQEIANYQGILQVNPSMSPEQIKKKAYADSLKEQIRLKEEFKRQEKQMQILEDKRIRQELQKYQYFGKGGGGGPRRNHDGEIIVLRNPNAQQTYNIYRRESYDRRLKVPNIEYHKAPIQEYTQPVIESPRINDQAELERQVKLREEAEMRREVAERRQVELETQIKEQQRLREQEEYERKMREEAELEKDKMKEKLLNRQLELEKKLRKEQMENEVIHQQLEEEKLKRKKQKLSIKYTKEHILKSIKEKEILAQAPIKHMRSVKLQANIEPIKTYRSVNTKVESNIFNNDFTRFSTELRCKEDRVLNSIGMLKVLYRKFLVGRT